MIFYVGLLPSLVALVAVLVWRARVAKRTPEQHLKRLRTLSEAAATAIRSAGSNSPSEQSELLSWKDVAAMYSNSRSVMLPMAKKLAEISPNDPEVVYTRLGLLKQHRRLRGFLFIHVVENIVDKVNYSLGASMPIRAYFKPAAWAYSEEILLLENLLEAVSASPTLVQRLEEIL